MTRPNPYAQSARARKVLAMLQRLPAEAFASPTRAAEFLATWPQSDRNALATHAGVTPPSEETWAQFVAAVRGHAEGEAA